MKSFIVTFYEKTKISRDASHRTYFLNLMIIFTMIRENSGKILEKSLKIKNLNMYITFNKKVCTVTKNIRILLLKCNVYTRFEYFRVS